MPFTPFEQAQLVMQSIVAGLLAFVCAVLLIKRK